MMDASTHSLVSREGRYAGRLGEILGRDPYEDVVMAIDWNRVLIEAQKCHLIVSNVDPTHDPYATTCGRCVLAVLLERDS